VNFKRNVVLSAVHMLCFVKISAINGNSLTKFNEVRRINGIIVCFVTRKYHQHC